MQVLSYAKDHTSALFQQAKEREERLREERASRRTKRRPQTQMFSRQNPGCRWCAW